MSACSIAIQYLFFKPLIVLSDAQLHFARSINGFYNQLMNSKSFKLLEASSPGGTSDSIRFIVELIELLSNCKGRSMATQERDRDSELEILIAESKAIRASARKVIDRSSELVAETKAMKWRFIQHRLDVYARFALYRDS